MPVISKPKWPLCKRESENTTATTATATSTATTTNDDDDDDDDNDETSVLMMILLLLMMMIMTMKYMGLTVICRLNMFIEIYELIHNNQFWAECFLQWILQLTALLWH